MDLSAELAGLAIQSLHSAALLFDIQSPHSHLSWTCSYPAPPFSYSVSYAGPCQLALRSALGRRPFSIPVIQNEPIVDPNCVLRFGPAATRYGLRESAPAAGGGAHMKHVAPHEISGPKSARPHGGTPSPGAEQRRGQWVVSGQ
jgi:hypothetical protein